MTLKILLTVGSSELTKFRVQGLVRHLLVQDNLPFYLTFSVKWEKYYPWEGGLREIDFHEYNILNKQAGPESLMGGSSRRILI